MTEKSGKRGITGAHIKWAAIILMLMDHIGAVILEPVLMQTTITVANRDTLLMLADVDRVLRSLGRFSFPAFCFLLVEGFTHTRNRAKYFRNLVIFAVLSEIPFNLAIGGRVITLEFQNVFLTLVLGYVAIWSAQVLAEKLGDRMSMLGWRLVSAAIMVATAITAEALNTDYGAVGVCVVCLFYYLHHKPLFAATMVWAVLTLLMPMEFYCVAIIPAVYWYNGERGRQNKYFFYVFYPVHLLILVAIRMFILG